MSINETTTSYKMELMDNVNNIVSSSSFSKIGNDLKRVQNILKLK